jgi:succinylarginine dihydrolase
MPPYPPLLPAKPDKLPVQAAQVPGEGVNPVHDRAGDEVEAFGVAGFVRGRDEELIEQWEARLETRQESARVWRRARGGIRKMRIDKKILTILNSSKMVMVKFKKAVHHSF